MCTTPVVGCFQVAARAPSAADSANDLQLHVPAFQNGRL